MEHFTPLASTLGGIMIGASAALLLFGLGRIAGISGILGGVLVPRAGDKAWRFAFLAGLVVGGAIMGKLRPELFAFGLDRRLLTVAIAGLLVGFGTRMGNGCTSGHGVCGLGRGSLRSFAATLAFMASAALTVFLSQHVFGGAS